MKDIEKVPAKLKVHAEDFIVEEVGEKWVCSVSQEFSEEQKPELDIIGEPNKFIWCELEKKDIDHFGTMKVLASGLGKGMDSIGYAGTKDKRAVTSQRISIFEPDLEKIKSFSHPNIILKKFRWAKRKIKLGYLDANNFRIVLRDIDKRDAMKISNKIRGMNWFPNYFGPQRFGSMRGNNVNIGKFLLKKDFEGAIWEILSGESEMEREEIREVRKRLKKEKDFKEAQKYFPPFLRLEKRLIDYLSRNPDDYIGAIKCSERKSVLMFVHAVQSQIFNDILERALGEGLDFTKKGQESCLLVGYKTRFYDGRLGEIEQEVLGEHGLKLEDFDLKEIPYLRIKGSFRKAVICVENLELETLDDEEFDGSKKILLSFTLPSGVYATTFLENFFEF
jgi:tRNA pseudouridine13 synthase